MHLRVEGKREALLTRHRSEREPSEPSESGEPRPVEHRHDPYALDRWRPTSELGASWRAYGLGRRGVFTVSASNALQPGGSNLAEPRSLCALSRPCLDAALLHAAPDRRKASEPWRAGDG